MRRVRGIYYRTYRLWLRPGRVQLAMGFGLAAVGMIAGLVIFLCAIVISHTPAALTKRYCVRQTSPAQLGMATGSAGGNACADSVLFWKEWSVYALIVATIIGLGFWLKFIAKQKTKNSVRSWADCDAHLLQYVVLGLRTTGRSSISLYIDRFVNRDMFGYTFRPRCSSQLMPSRLCCAVCSGMGG